MANNLSSVNFPGIVAGILALVSIFVSWWGIVTTGLGLSTSVMYGLFGQSSQFNQQGINSNFSQYMATYTPIILALALTTIALAVLGSFTSSARPLGAGLALAISTLVGWSALVSYALSQNCQGNGCIRDVTGSANFFNITTTWGFQTGFYLFLGATISLVIALVYHMAMRRPAATATVR